MIAAMLLIAQVPVAIAECAGDRLTFRDSQGNVIAEHKASGRTEWRPKQFRLDGTALALRSSAGELGIATLKDGSIEIKSVGEGSEPSWTPRGDLIYSLPKIGVGRWRTAGDTEVLIPGGTFASPSPDGNRIAFAASSGLWVADANGEQATRIAAARIGYPPSWSLDSRWIAFMDGTIARIIGPNGRRVQSLGEFDPGRLVWSPGAPLLLGKRRGKWSVWDFRDKSVVTAPVAWQSEPQWVGPMRLGGITDGKWMEWRIGQDPVSLPYGKGLVEAVANAGVMLGPAFPSPFATAPKPGFGVTAWRGRMLAIDPIRGQLTMAVESETMARSEQFFAKPQTRTIRYGDALTPILIGELNAEGQILHRAGRVVSYFSVERQEAFDPALLARTEPASGKRPVFRMSADGWPIVPIVYPIPGKHRFVDTWGAPRDGGRRKHQGNDLMAPKMTPLLAVFDGTFNGGSVRSDDGVNAIYLHLNNDTPGTDDGRGGPRYTYPAGLRPGARVRAGQVIAFCGDSGNAEETGAHLHFELHVPGFGVVNPAPSLRAAQRLPEPRIWDRHSALKPGAGETRLEGVVHNVDPKKRVLVIDLMASQTHGNPLRPNLMPSYAYLVFPEGKGLGFADLPDVQYDFTQARPGMKVAAIGRGSATRIEVLQAELGFLD